MFQEATVAQSTLENIRDDIAKIMRASLGKPMDSDEEIHASMTVEQRQMNGALELMTQIADSLAYIGDKIDNIDNKYLG